MHHLTNTRYRLERLLGEGGMGRVYLAHDTVREHPVALKEILGDSAKHEDLKREFWWMSRLEHPNLLKVYDFGATDDGRPFFTMELVDGQPLDQLVPLDPEQLKPLLVQLCRVLRHLHHQGLVHADIKPENIWRLPDGTLKLMDFGLITPANQPTSLRGTPAFMPPELIQGAPVDQRADLYSLGVLAYQMLTGTLPFQAPTLTDLLKAHLEQTPTPPSQIRPLDPSWDTLLARLLAKEPQKRFASAAELLEALGEPVHDEKGTLLASPFVGRTHLLAPFERALRQLHEGQSTRRLTFLGATGTGKSRLLDELAFKAQLEGATVWRGRATATPAPYEPFVELLKQAWPTLESLDASLLDAHAPVLALVAPALIQHPQAHRLEPRQEKLRLQFAFSELFAAAADKAPLVLLFDDFQHADALSRELCDHLQRKLEGAPILWGFATDQHDPQHLALEPLEPQEIAAMASAMLAVEHVPQPFLDQLGTVTGGLPQHVERVLAHLVEHQHLPRRQGRWVLEPVPPQALPPSLAEALDQKRRALPPCERAILELAAVLARPFDLAWLERLLPQYPSEARYEALARLVADQLLTTRDGGFLAPQARLLTLTLEPDHLTLLHAQVAEALEEQEPKDDALVLALAHHFLQSPRAAKATHYALDAARRLAALFDNDQAKDLLERGSALLEAQPEALRLDYLALKGDLARRAGDFKSAEEHYRDVLERQPQRADLLVNLGIVKQMTSQYDEAVEQFQRALPHCDSHHRLRALVALGRAYYQKGDRERSRATYQQALEQARQEDHLPMVGACLGFMGLLSVSGETGDVEEGLAFLRESIRIKESTGDRLGLNDSLMLLGNALLALGLLEEAEAAFSRNQAICHELNALEDETFAFLNLALVALEAGRHALALERLEHVERLAAPRGNAFVLGLARCLEAKARCHLGQLERPLPLLQEVLDQARTLKIPFLGLYAQLSRAVVLERLGSHDEALTAAREAERLQEETGIRDYALRLACEKAALEADDQPLHQALALAEAKQARHLQAFCLLHLAHRQPQAAQEQLERACALAREAAAEQLLAECRFALACTLEEEQPVRELLALVLESAERLELPELRARALFRIACLTAPSRHASRLAQQAQGLMQALVQPLAHAAKEAFLDSDGREAILEGLLPAQYGEGEADKGVAEMRRQTEQLQLQGNLFRRYLDFSQHVALAADPAVAVDQALSLLLHVTQASRAEVLLWNGQQLKLHARKAAPDLPPIEEPWDGYADMLDQALQSRQTLYRPLVHDLGPQPRSLLALPLVGEQEAQGLILLLGDPTLDTPLVHSELATAAALAHQISATVRNLQLQQAHMETSRRLSMLNEVGKAVASSLDLDEVLAVLLDKTLAVTRGNKAYVIMPTREGLSCRYGLDRQGRREQGLEISYTLADRVLQSREAICILDTGADASAQTASVMALDLQSIMCVPMLVQDELIGLLYVTSNSVTHTFTDADLDLLIAIAGQAALSVQNALYVTELEEKKRMQEELARVGQELEIARRIQTALLPKDLAVEGYELALELETATEVGGDLIEYLPQPDGQFWLAIGDVTGHGLTSGLIMMIAQSTLSGLIEAVPHGSPAAILTQLNRALYHNIKGRMANDSYLTLQVMRHLGDGAFVTAGMHLDMLIFRKATGLVEQVEIPGFWTGFLPDVADMMEDFHFRLEPEDVLLLYTDGVIEGMNDQGEQFDMERLKEAFQRLAARAPAEIRDALLLEVRAWLHEQFDDMSLIVLKRRP